MTTGRFSMGTQPATSIHWRRVAEGVAETTTTCVTSSLEEMHVAGLKTGTESGSVMSRNNTMKGTMTIMVPTAIKLTSSVL
jgi:hypothetical protein